MGTKVASEKKDLFQEELDYLSGISERTWFKIGSAINFLNEKHAEKHHFNCNGNYGPVSRADGMFVCPFAMEIVAISFSNGLSGASGTTTYDVHWFSASGTDQGTIFSTPPSIDFNAPNDAYGISNFIVPSSQGGTGIVLPVLSKSTFAFGDALRWDIDAAMFGAEDTSLGIYFRPI